MSEPIPSYAIVYSGKSLDRVPPFLRCFTDCIDGVISIDDWETSADGTIIGTRWALFRSGERVGEVAALFDYMPYGSGPG